MATALSKGTTSWSSFASYGRKIGPHPHRWRDALVLWLAHVPSSWWRRSPHLPVPDRGWLAFRAETAYGDRAARPDAAEFAEFLDWSARMRQLRRHFH